jgi:hypothetical protein
MRKVERKKRRTQKGGAWYDFRPTRFHKPIEAQAENLYLTPSRQYARVQNAK